MSYRYVRERTWQVLEGTRREDRLSRWVQGFIITVIVLNVAAVVLATVQELQDEYDRFFWYFEVVSVAIFTVEYAARIWACTVDDRFRGPIRGRLRFAVTPGAIIDLLAILPFFLPRLTSIDLRGIRAVRILRLLRLLKLGKYSESATLLWGVLTSKREQILLALLAVIVALVFVSSMMYFAERTAQPDKFASIPQSMWWGVITLTTVGYGDVYPVTTVGKVLGGCISLLGIGLFALPAGILASGFEEAMEKKQERREERRSDDDGESEEDDGSDERAEGAQSDRYCSCCGQPLPDDQRDE